MKRLLLLSNSTLPGQSFLEWPTDYLTDLLGRDRKTILFFPYAGVTIRFDDYFERVAERFAQLGHDTISAHQVTDKKAAIGRCDVIAVGGGNTFHLVRHLHEGWMSLIRERVMAGVPYIGWSAGSNVACPSIRTTNDMPIVEPLSFEALGLIPYQINPHFTDERLPNHGGESRSDRIREFLAVNPDRQVLGLPEGTLLQVEGEEIVFRGRDQLSIFRHGEPVRVLTDGGRIH